MRLLERDKRTVALRARGENTHNPYGEPLPAWGEPVPLRACVQPLTGGLAAEVYGQRVADMRLMLCGEPARLAGIRGIAELRGIAGLAALREGDGVCADVPPDAAPDYRVVSVQRWRGHWRIHLERIPERTPRDGIDAPPESPPREGADAPPESPPPEEVDTP